MRSLYFSSSGAFESSRWHVFTLLARLWLVFFLIVQDSEEESSEEEAPAVPVKKVAAAPAKAVVRPSTAPAVKPGTHIFSEPGVLCRCSFWVVSVRV